MRNFGFVLLAISILLGGVAVLGLRHMNARPAARGPVPSTTVVVAARPIGFGEPLTPEVLRVQAWPQGARPQGSFQTVAQVISGQRRVALAPITANEPILATRVSGPGGRATLSGVIRAGMRAAAIRVNDVVGVAGFVLPGDFVDVLLTRSDGQGDDNMRTDVLIRSVRVLAVDQLANENKNDPVVAKAVTVEVTPEQAQQLALATQVGNLSLALRGTVDPLSTSGEAAQTLRINDLRLWGATDAKRPAVTRVVTHTRRAAPRRIQRASIEIFRGMQSVRVPAMPELVG